MGPDEVKDEAAARQQLADALLAKVRYLLEEAGLEILSFRTSSRECYDCPEYPGECRNCRADRSCVEMLRPQVVTLVVGVGLPRGMESWRTR